MHNRTGHWTSADSVFLLSDGREGSRGLAWHGTRVVMGAVRGGSPNTNARINYISHL